MEKQAKTAPTLNRTAIGSSNTAFPDSLMPSPTEVEESFQTYRTYLFSIAYRMLGSAMDAEDMVQETYLRYQRATPGTLMSLKAYLTTILTRLCIDQLHLARKKRETYLGSWLPEPILTASDSTMTEERVDRHEALSLAFLTLLEELQPVERAVFLLREVFDYDYPEIADFVGKSEVACRKLFSRAKNHIAEKQQRYSISAETHRQLLTGFLEVVQAGDMSALMNMLAEDVVLRADGGGKVRGAATRTITGRAATAQFVLGANLDFLPPNYVVELAEVNTQPAVIVRDAGRALVVLTIETDAKGIRAIWIMANPDKLAHL
jgi:RNA polymerase sigma-70 factor, ECF subfamily